MHSVMQAVLVCAEGLRRNERFPEWIVTSFAPVE